MNKKIFTVTALTLGALGILGTSSVMAYQGDVNVKGPNYSPERHVAMTQAFEKNDYNTWKKLMEGKGNRVMQVINEKNFAKFAQAHKLMLEGKNDEANKIRAELGLGLHNGSGMGQGMGNGRSNR